MQEFWKLVSIWRSYEQKSSVLFFGSVYKQEKKEASYKKQKEAGDKINKHTNNLYSAEIYNVSMAH